MPFTVSHAAVVLPLLRYRRLDPLGLVIGSMVPDLGYYFHRFDLASQAHSFRGSLLIALPLGWLTWLAMKTGARILAAPLPDPERIWVTGFLRATSPSPAWLQVTVSLLLGIWSHNFLDAFTHASGWFVQRFSLLHEPWPLFHVLQHLGSVAGMLILLGVYIARRRVLGRWHWTSRHRELALGGLLGVAVAFPIAWSFASRFEGWLLVRALGFRWIITSLALASLAYLVFGLFLWISERKTRSD